MNYEHYIDIILNYWFTENHESDFKRWFQEGKGYDQEIIHKFKKILHLAEQGKLLHWFGSKKGYLAHIILLDQFSRHIYRNTSKAYSNDALALYFMELGLSRYLHTFSAREQMFVLMPYQHTNDIEKQHSGVTILKNLVQNSNTKNKNLLRVALQHQKAHCKVIEKFNRFPKRNKDLNLISTAAETKYILNNPNLPY